MKSINEALPGTIEKGKNIIEKISDILQGNPDKSPNAYLGGSISQYSKNLVMTFPVLCDNTISPETASMINKANERNIATMLMMLFTAMNIEANDGMKVLSMIHKNITTSMDVYDVMDKMNQIGNDLKDFKESGKIETVKGEFSKESEVIREMIDELKYGKTNKSFPVNSLNEESLNRFTITRGYKNIIVKEAVNPYNKTPQELDLLLRQVYTTIGQMYGDTAAFKTDIDAMDWLNSKEFEKLVYDIAQKLNLKIDINDAVLNKMREDLTKKIENDIKNGWVNKDANLKFSQGMVAKLVDTDVKKANEVQPTVLQINYSQKTENGFEIRTFLAGVKSRLIAVDSTDMVERIIAKNRTKINFLNFIRATTGEIRFFHDFLFAIDQAKLDSKNAVKKGEAAKIWNCLANRAAKNTNNKLKKAGNDASAITVLVLSQETVNYMKNVHKFDLEKMNNTKAICDAYNLMGIIIADESIEVVKTYYVGNNNYEQTAYSFLEKQNSDRDYKKMINLIGKTNAR